MTPSLRFAIAALLLIALFTGGTAGYRLVEGWTIRESAYMTLITITTVGFGEVRPLSPAGQRFTILLIVFGLFTAGYAATVVVGYVFEGQIVRTVKERRLQRQLKRLKNHYIVCGAGDVGREVALELQRSKMRFCVVDRDPQASELARDESILLVTGDAVNDEVLQEAGVERAVGLISALPEDEQNVFVVLTARQLNPKLVIVSQAAEESTIRKLRKAGADRVISPKQIAGRRMASVMLRPSVVSFLEVMVQGTGVAMRIEEVIINADSPLVGKNLRETGIGSHTGAIIVGINDQAGHTRMNPTSGSLLSAVTLKEGDVLIALGNDEQIHRLRDFVNKGR
jgi:voltage-gated potassium channel